MTFRCWTPLARSIYLSALFVIPFNFSNVESYETNMSAFKVFDRVAICSIETSVTRASRQVLSIHGEVTF